MQSQAVSTGLSKPTSYPSWLWLCFAFFLLMIFVKPAPVGGDTALYADEIRTSLSHGWSESHHIWNFAHLAWRPLGRLLAEAFLGPLLPYFNGNANMAIAFLLMVPNLISTLICGLVVQRAVWKMTGNQWVSLITGIAFVCLNPLLNYSRLGSPYCCCLACSSLALYFAAFHESDSWRTAALSGALGGAAAVFWAPFLLSFPSIALSRWILNYGRKKFDFRFIAIVCISGGLTVVTCYGIAMAELHIHNWSGLMTWLHESTPDSQTHTALRMVNGIGRSFYEMGDDSVWLKWYLYHDPYAKVSIWDLVKLSFTELALFYLALLSLLMSLWTSPTGKRLLALIAVTMLPHIALAVLYESGGGDRYMAFLPVIFIGFGYVIADQSLSVAQRAVVAVLCCLHIPANLATASVRNVGYLVHKEPDRLAVMTSLTPNNLLYVVNGRDSLFRLSYGDPLNPLHRQPMAIVRSITPSVGPEMPRWRSIFACAVLSAWDHQEEVWVTKRVLAQQPIRSWTWMEGDNELTWPAVRQFFLDFDHSHERGGDDGFFLIRDTPETRQPLSAALAGSSEPGCTSIPKP
jgi:hypothetical protein